MKDSRDDSGFEKRLQDFRAYRRSAAKADAGFTGRIMDAVRDWEREQQRAGAREGDRRTTMPRRPGFAIFPFGDPKARGYRVAWARPALGMAFSLLLLLTVSGLFYIGRGTQGRPEGPDITRIKGEGFRLGFLLKREGRLATAVPGMVFRPGDLLQAVYSAPSRGRFHLYSLDEAGNILCFSCASPDTVLPAGRDRPLAYALELDASPRREVFAGFWSERPVSSEEVSALLKDAWLAAGRDLASFPDSLRRRLSPGLEASIFPIRKQETNIHGIH